MPDWLSLESLMLLHHNIKDGRSVHDYHSDIHYNKRLFWISNLTSLHHSNELLWAVAHQALLECIHVWRQVFRREDGLRLLVGVPARGQHDRLGPVVVDWTREIVYLASCPNPLQELIVRVVQL